MGFNPDSFPQAQEYYKSAISLPIFYGLTYSQQDNVVLALKNSLALN
jgi:dTDP-4-amino-4,6-dideoxygalactose transaminase